MQRKQLALRLKRSASLFSRDSWGNISVTFALLALPLICVTGLGVDYSIATRNKTDLQALVDSAALNGANAMSAQLQRDGAGTQSVASAKSEAIRLVADQVNAGLVSMQISGATTTTSPSVNDGAPTVKVELTAQSPTVFASLFRFEGVPVHVESEATLAKSRVAYGNYYIAIDTSQSMGIAGSNAGIAQLTRLTGCAFGCHGTSSPTNQQIAQQNRIDLRIDLARMATYDFVTTLLDRPNRKTTNVGIYGINKTLTTLAPASSDLVALRNRIGTDTRNSIIDLGAVTGRGDAQTSFLVSLPMLDRLIPANGTGASADSPQNFVFIVTDGLSDEKLNGSRTFGVMDPALCAPLKQKATVAVLYTDYFPVPNDGSYTKNVAPRIANGTLVNGLKNCASPGFFFQLANFTDLLSAMDTRFSSVGNAQDLRLTR